jgi:hypothetical protein
LRKWLDDKNEVNNEEVSEEETEITADEVENL